MATRKKREPGTGRFSKAGVVLMEAIAGLGLSRKEFADAIEVQGGERTVGHWVNGATWPRDVKTRAKIRGLFREAVWDELVSEWAKALGLPHMSHAEMDVLEVYRDPSAAKSIDAAIQKWREAKKGTK